ncbi:hypothetical protein NA57DRAFT_59997 [Rhizodiscina lignyota]|uniref:Uncharacterized protein n=1 Tax=Rhizodiscina lignyota TaxID=1504668 RepID=A0A9P4M5F6_9PEZI|nr:hypothetical protein NA57DRAFT_59997 [Rhizodiscina lignyota]
MGVFGTALRRSAIHVDKRQALAPSRRVDISSRTKLDKGHGDEGRWRRSSLGNALPTRSLARPRSHTPSSHARRSCAIYFHCSRRNSHIHIRARIAQLGNLTRVHDRQIPGQQLEAPLPELVPHFRLVKLRWPDSAITSSKQTKHRPNDNDGEGQLSRPRPPFCCTQARALMHSNHSAGLEPAPSLHTARMRG